MNEFGNIEDLKDFGLEIIEQNQAKILTEDEKKKKRDLILKDKYLNFHFQKLKNLKGYKMPEKNEISFIITLMSFNAFTFIPHILKTEKIISLNFSTFNLSKGVILALGDFITSGAISEAFILIHQMMKYEHHDIIEILELYKNHLPVTYKETRNHSKINCIQTENNFYIISGSGNFSNNANIEQYIIINDQKIHNEIVEFFSEL